jgi:protein-disulfide isomerase
VAVSVAQCVLEKRTCAACLSAAKVIAQAVRDGMAREQVQDLYKQRFDTASAKRIPIEGSPARGPQGGPVVLVEFADFECPFCQKLAPELDSLWEKHKDKVLFVYKFMPLSMHPHGELAARAAIAAQAQGKFWEMHHQLFTNGQHLEQSDIEGYAKSIGLDVARFRADMQSAATSARLDADRKLADQLGVKGTPTIYIDGRPYDTKVDIEQWVEGDIAANGSGH